MQQLLGECIVDLGCALLADDSSRKSTKDSRLPVKCCASVQVFGTTGPLLHVKGKMGAHLLAELLLRHAGHPPGSATQPPLQGYCRALLRRRAGACQETALHL